MRLNILYPLYAQPNVNGTVVTNAPINIDNVTHLSFDDEYYHDQRGYSRITFHLVNGNNLEWVIPEKKGFQMQCNYLKEISVYPAEVSN